MNIQQQIENLAVAMGVTVGDVKSFVRVIAYEMQNGAGNIEEAIKISKMKYDAMLKDALSQEGSKAIRESVADMFYGATA